MQKPQFHGPVNSNESRGARVVNNKRRADFEKHTGDTRIQGARLEVSCGPAVGKSGGDWRARAARRCSLRRVVYKCAGPLSL